MTTRFNIRRIVYITIPVLLACIFTVSAFERNDVLRFTRADLSVDDLASIYGLNIYKFNLESSGAKEYRMILREKHAEDKPWKSLFSEVIRGNNEEKLLLTVSFTRVDGQFGRVFFSSQNHAEFSIKLCTEKQCFAEMSTIIPVPLLNHDGVLLNVHRSASDVPENEPNKIRLLTMKPSSRLAEKTGDSVYPRAELTLETVL